MRRAWTLAVLLGLACGASSCKSKDPAPASVPGGSGSSGSAAVVAIDAAVAIVAPPAPSWKLDSKAVALDCGDDPLKLLPPSAATGSAAERTLAHATPMTECQGQASAAAVCACLATSSYAPAECAPSKPVGSDAEVIELDSKPDNPSHSAIESFVLVARRGSAWSAIADVEHSTVVDYSETPKMADHASVTRVETRPVAEGTLYWIESQSEQTEHGIGEHDHDGEAHATICIVPSAAGSAAYCDAPFELATWTYALDDSKSGPDACTISSISVHSVTLDGAARTATVTLTAGSDSGSAAGRYRF